MLTNTWGKHELSTSLQGIALLVAWSQGWEKSTCPQELAV